MMKKIVLAVLVGFMLFFTACNDDDAYSLGDIWLGFGVLTGEQGSFTIIMDNSDKLIPVASSYPGWQTQFESGDRVLVNYTVLDDNLTEDSAVYYVKINDIEDILMKGIMDITEENADSIGNDPIIVEDYWLTDSLLSFKLKYRGLHEIHFLNLVKQPGDITADDQPIQLELRHNANDDEDAVLYTAFVSFSLNSLRINDLDSIQFEVTSTDYDGVTETIEGVFNYEDLEWPMP